MARVLVIGATGRVGRHVVSQFAPVRALVRNPAAANLPAHVEVVRGDLTIPDSLDPALDGIETVFLVWTAPAAAAAPALERILSRARRIVFLSAPLKTAHPMVQQPNPLRTLIEEIERRIEASGLEWTFLRPGMFAGNALWWWAPQTRAGEIVRWPYLAVPTAPIDERDIAAVAVRALGESGHAKAEYVLTGPESLTQAEQISIIGSVIGRSLRMEEMSPEKARLASIPDMLLDAWAAAIGHPAFVSSTFAEVTGSAPRTFREWAQDHAAEF